MELAAAARDHVAVGLLGAYRVGVRPLVRSVERVAGQSGVRHLCCDPDRRYAGLVDPARSLEYPARDDCSGALVFIQRPAARLGRLIRLNSVLIERQAEILVVTINRPEVRNAVDGATAGQLADAFRKFDADDQAKVAVLTGAGGTFCAGADLKAIAAGHGNRMSEE